MRQPTDPTRPHFYVAELETTQGQAWMSLHITEADAMNKLAEVAWDWDIKDDLDDAPEIERWEVSHLPVHNIGE